MAKTEIRTLKEEEVAITTLIGKTDKLRDIIIAVNKTIMVEDTTTKIFYGQTGKP